MPIPSWGDGHHCTHMGTIWAHFLVYPSQTRIFIGKYLVELVGIEPTTSSLRTMRSPSLSSLKTKHIQRKAWFHSRVFWDVNGTRAEAGVRLTHSATSTDG